MATIKILQNVSINNSLTALSTVKADYLIGNLGLSAPQITHLANTSASWNAAYTIANAYTAISANPVVQTLTANVSAKINRLAVGSSGFNNNEVINVLGDVIVSGNLSANGTMHFANTYFTTTSSLCVVNHGTGPALEIHQEGDQAVAAFYDQENGIGLWVDGAISRPGYVGVKTTTPNKELTVMGDISASGMIYGKLDPNGRKYSTLIGDNSATSFTVTHNLSTEDIVVSVIESVSKQVVIPAVTYSTVNTVTVEFNFAPSLTAYKVIVIS
jgi:hypothetical protein